MEKNTQMKERDVKKVFQELKSQFERFIAHRFGYDSTLDQAFDYYIRVGFHTFLTKFIQNLDQLEKLINKEELQTCDCKESLRVFKTHLQNIFDPYVMNQSEFVDAFENAFRVQLKMFKAKCMSNMDELEKILVAMEGELNEQELIEREMLEKQLLIKEREQIEQEKLIKEREQIEREKLIKEKEQIEREKLSEKLIMKRRLILRKMFDKQLQLNDAEDTERELQTKIGNVNDGNTSDGSSHFTENDTSSEQQGESSSPGYDSDADGIHGNKAVWDTKDGVPLFDTDKDIFAEVQQSIDNVFAHDQTHPAHSKSVSDTYVVEQEDNNITSVTPDMDPNGSMLA